MATETQPDTRPTLTCPKCGRAAFINLKLKLIHVNTEMRACADPKPA